MIKLEDGLCRGGRCVCGNQIGYILHVDRTTYSIRWIDGNITTQLRPDLDDDEDSDFFVEEEANDRQAWEFDHNHDMRKNWIGS